MYRLHGMRASGNCYKAKLLFELTGTDYEWIEVDLFNGDARRPEFLAMNPNGKVPVLELPDGQFLPESNAILYYLAQGTLYFPEDRFEAARVMQWLFFEQYSHEPYVAVARFIKTFLPADHSRHAELPRLLERGHEALAVMDRHLDSREFLETDKPTIADIALFAYTHCAADGGFDLSVYASLNAWLERIRKLEGFVEM